jgi:hypothetical protein
VTRILKDRDRKVERHRNETALILLQKKFRLKVFGRLGDAKTANGYATTGRNTMIKIGNVRQGNAGTPNKCYPPTTRLGYSSSLRAGPFFYILHAFLALDLDLEILADGQASLATLVDYIDKHRHTWSEEMRQLFAADPLFFRDMRLLQGNILNCKMSYGMQSGSKLTIPTKL